jgi:hypothetical protein
MQLGQVLLVHSYVSRYIVFFLPLYSKIAWGTSAERHNVTYCAAVSTADPTG